MAAVGGSNLRGARNEGDARPRGTYKKTASPSIPYSTSLHVSSSQSFEQAPKVLCRNADMNQVIDDSSHATELLIELMRPSTPLETLPVPVDSTYGDIYASQTTTTMQWNHPYFAALMEAGIHSCIQPPSFMNDMSTCPPDIKMISNPPTPASSLEYPAQSSPSSSEDFYDKFDSLDNISSGEWRSVDEGIKRLSPAVENAASSEEDSYDSFDNLNDIRSEGWRAIEEDVKRLLPPLPASFITWNDEERTRTNMKPGSPESERAKEGAAIKSMASLPFVQGSVAGITHVRKVDNPPQMLVSIIEGHLARGHYVYMRDVPNEPLQWSLDGLRDGLGLQSVGVVSVSSLYSKTAEQRTVAQFMEGCEDKNWAVIEHPVSESGLPKFTGLLDHGYHFGWGGMIPGEESIERSPAVERQHSWASLLPALYLKHAKPEDLGDTVQGQATVMQVRGGLLFMACYILKNAHQAASRKELYALHDEPNFERYLLALRPGDVIVLPPGACYHLFAAKSTVVVGRRFYSFCCLHLSEVSRIYSSHRVDNTNPKTALDAVEAWETLTRLLAMIPFIDKPMISTKALLSLVAMCRSPARYIGTKVDVDVGLHMNKVSSAVSIYIGGNSRQIEENQDLFNSMEKRSRKGRTVAYSDRYVLALYQRNAIDISQKILHALDPDGSRYTYPWLKQVNGDIVLVEDEKDFIFVANANQLWRELGPPIGEKGWKDMAK